MKKLFAIVAALTFAVLVNAAGVGGATGVSGLRTHDHSTADQGGTALAPSTIAQTGTHSSTKACAASYARTGPNFCQRTTLSSTSLTRDTCIAISLPAGDAKGIYGAVFITVAAGNSAGVLRSVNVSTYSDSGCVTSIVRNARLDVMEFSATASGTAIGINHAHMQIPSSATFYMKMTDDAGDQGSAAFHMLGYFD